MTLRLGRLRPLCLALCGIVAGGIPVALAQEGGLSLRLSVSPSLIWRDNPDLVADPGPAETSVATGLSFGLLSETRTQSLSFEANALLDSNADVGRDGLVDPQLRLSYRLRSAAAELETFARYRQSDLDDRSFPFDLDGDGIDDTDPVITFSGGQQEDLQYGFALRTGIDRPFGLTLDASRRDRTFTQTVDPSLYDTEETRAGLLASFRIDPRITLRTTARQVVRDIDDPEATRRTTTSLGFGGDFAITPVLRLAADVTSDRVRTEQLSGDEVREGAGLVLALTRTLPNGTLAARFSSDIDQNGRTDELRLTRELTLADDAQAAFAFGLGRNEDDELRTLLQFSYQRALRNGEVSARLSQELRNDDDDVPILDTRLTAAWSRDLGPTTSFSTGVSLADLEALDDAADDRRRARLEVGLTHQVSARDRIAADVSFGVTEVSGPGGARSDERVDVGLSYNRLLAQDWSLVARYSHVSLTESGAADRVGNTVSIGLQRTFEWRN